MSQTQKATCASCAHFKSAPYEARLEGCYLPENMDSKQSAFYLDEQQLPGNHRILNLGGKCGDYAAKAPKPSLLKRLTLG